MTQPTWDVLTQVAHLMSDPMIAFMRTSSGQRSGAVFCPSSSRPDPLSPAWKCLLYPLGLKPTKLHPSLPLPPSPNCKSPSPPPSHLHNPSSTQLCITSLRLIRHMQRQQRNHVVINFVSSPAISLPNLPSRDDDTFSFQIRGCASGRCGHSIILLTLLFFLSYVLIFIPKEFFPLTTLRF